MEKQQSQKNILNNKYTKGLVIAAVALFAIFKGPEIYQDRKNISHIKKGRLEYTTKGGWIDRGHATPGGARHLRNRVKNPKDIPGNQHYGWIHYGQHQRAFNMKDGVEKSYIIRKNMTKEEQESVALAIFLEVSREFEEHQGLTDFITGSSYDAADIFSNVVGFYRAVREYSEDEVRSYLGPVGADSSLVLYEQKGIGKNTSIGTFIKKDEEDEVASKYPYPFNQIRTVRKGKFYGKTGILFKDMTDIPSSDKLLFVGYSPTGLDMFNVTKAYETQVSEHNIKLWLQEIDPIRYQNIATVIIKNKGTHREAIADK